MRVFYHPHRGKNCLKVSLFVYLYQDVGCDHLIGSGAKEDICGVCKGNGTSCRTVEGRFNQLAGSGINLLSVFSLIVFVNLERVLFSFVLKDARHA